MALTTAMLGDALDAAVASARSMPADDALQPKEGETREEREARNKRLVGARLAANSSVNLLTPVLLNACRKASENKPLTDLETDLVDLARLAAPTPDDIAGYGQAFAGLAADQSAALFPEDTAGLGADSSYSYADGARDLPKYWDRISALPNVIKPGARLDEGSLPSAEDIQRLGWSRPLPTEDAEDLPGGLLGFIHSAVVELVKAKCHSDTVGEWGDDEVYFIIHTSNKKRGSTSTTQTVEHFKDGVTQNYNYRQFVAHNVGKKEYPPPPETGPVIGIIEGWEEDYGKSKVMEEIKKKANEISEKLIEGIKDPTKKKGQLQAAAGVILAIVSLFIEAWCDDFIALNSFELDDSSFKNKEELAVMLVRKNDYGHETLEWGKYEAFLQAHYDKREM
ncbi:hypothetical protein ACF07L_34985 [Streptomyces anulatus]|uniref:hypothetical protein n=1 Tax=Streptomyces anulatus TaxID=1892 RepID=UPI0036FB7998